jgi:hypothetical protein
MMLLRKTSIRMVSTTDNPRLTNISVMTSRSALSIGCLGGLAGIATGGAAGNSG